MAKFLFFCRSAVILLFFQKPFSSGKLISKRQVCWKAYTVKLFFHCRKLSTYFSAIFFVYHMKCNVKEVHVRLEFQLFLIIIKCVVYQNIKCCFFIRHNSGGVHLKCLKCLNLVDNLIFLFV